MWASLRGAGSAESGPDSSRNLQVGVVQEKPKPKVIALHKVMRAAILAAVIESNGNVCLAAEKLEIGKTTLYRKLQEYGVVPNRYRTWKMNRCAAGNEIAVQQTNKLGQG